MRSWSRTRKSSCGRTCKKAVSRSLLTKRCPRCGATKDVAEFPRNRATHDGLATYCKPCHNATIRRNKEKLHGSERQFRLRLRYGIDETDLAWLALQQADVCGICGSQTRLHVDHDHRSGKVRGLLCFNCNRGLGYIRDDVQVLRNAVQYLEEASHS
ncbi:MAG: endonuclease VII domain-containing protein [Actinomycetota bacterium]